jgi:2-desacetyl-2-hydroxyethyl bacteriochlorophyllide A dehydrogenase
MATLTGDCSATSVWFTSPRLVELRESTVRTPGAGEVRIGALFSGISHGTEMMAYRGEVPAELPLDSTLASLQGSFSFPIKYGYANVGRVLDVGQGVEEFADGDLVFAFNPHETCFTISAANVIKLPRELEPRTGVFVANTETALNSVWDATPRLGERALVIGQGVVGLLITQLLRKAGASLIVTADLYDKRRDLSIRAGADLTVDPSSNSLTQRVLEATGGLGADVVIEASGQPRALNDAIACTAPEGRIVVVSWYGTKPAELNLGGDFHRKRLTIKSSQVSNLDPSLAPRWTIPRRRSLAVQYLSELTLDGLITQVFPFHQASDAYKVIDNQPADVVQVLLDYNQ